MKKVVVLNTKGGCGKTTITTNLAAYHAMAGYRTTLMDYDPQGSSTRWLSKREETRPRVNSIAAFERNTRVTHSFQLRAPLDTEYLFIDTPAGLDPHLLTEITRNAHAVVVPVLPSDIDIHAASRCIADLLLIARIDRREDRIAVVANRANKNTRIYHALTRFLPAWTSPSSPPFVIPRTTSTASNRASAFTRCRTTACCAIAATGNRCWTGFTAARRIPCRRSMARHARAKPSAERCSS